MHTISVSLFSVLFCMSELWAFITIKYVNFSILLIFHHFISHLMYALHNLNGQTTKIWFYVLLWTCKLWYIHMNWQADCINFHFFLLSNFSKLECPDICSDQCCNFPMIIFMSVWWKIKLNWWLYALKSTPNCSCSISSYIEMHKYIFDVCFNYVAVNFLVQRYAPYTLKGEFWMFSTRPSILYTCVSHNSFSYSNYGID